LTLKTYIIIFEVAKKAQKFRN